jgi:ribosome-interacting GTPase 1
MIVMILDATKRAEQRALLEAELDAVGIRLNQDPPNIYLKPKTAGGVKITFQATPKNLDQKMLYNILKDYRILNCEVLIRDEDGMCGHLLRSSCVAFRLNDVAGDSLTIPQRPSTSSSMSS